MLADYANADMHEHRERETELDSLRVQVQSLTNDISQVKDGARQEALKLQEDSRLLLKELQDLRAKHSDCAVNQHQSIINAKEEYKIKLSQEEAKVRQLQETLQRKDQELQAELARSKESEVQISGLKAYALECENKTRALEAELAKYKQMNSESQDEILRLRERKRKREGKETYLQTWVHFEETFSGSNYNPVEHAREWFRKLQEDRRQEDVIYITKPLPSDLIVVYLIDIADGYRSIRYLLPREREKVEYFVACLQNAELTGYTVVGHGIPQKLTDIDVEKVCEVTGACFFGLKDVMTDFVKQLNKPVTHEQGFRGTENRRKRDRLI
jgi:DNA repair exonuclease SbcCD ATPase subunit